MKKKRFAVELDEDTFKMLKVQAEKAKLGKRAYFRLCLIQCKSDIGVSKC